MFDCLVKKTTKLDQLLDIADELNDWEYHFVMDMAEQHTVTDGQANLINKMVYDKIEVYI